MKKNSEFFFLCVLILLLMFWVSRCTRVKAQVVPLHKEYFDIEYNVCLGVPTQVDWVITKADVLSPVKRKSWRFKIDREAPKPRVSSTMYDNTGYDRGHMCPAADRAGTTEAMRSTFIMTNVCPQVPALNRGCWKAAEEACRQLAIRHGRCSVRVAPFWFPQDTFRIANGRIAVPHAFVRLAWLEDRQSFHKIWMVINK